MLISNTSLKRILNGIQKLYPIALADSRWDNTGLLLDSSSNLINEEEEEGKLKILLTIDLTQSVVEEAIENKTNVILAYHPFIFKGIKSITPQLNPQHDSLIKLIQNGISVYCPHTAIDAAKNGVNDWLCDVISDKSELKTKKIIEPCINFKNENENEIIGMGRIIELKKSLSLNEIITNVKKNLQLKNIQISKKKQETKEMISKIAICAGSGSSIFNKCNLNEIDLFFTGELSHHEALYYKEMNKIVICCNHSNTERGFLKILKNQLNIEFNNEIEILISENDTDPFEII